PRQPEMPKMRAIVDTARRCARLHGRMARRSRRELDIADHLWDCLTRIAEDCGTDRHAVVNQAIYEFARRFNFLTPMAKEVPLPDEIVGPGKPMAQARPGGGSDAPPMAAKQPKPAPPGNGSSVQSPDRGPPAKGP